MAKICVKCTKLKELSEFRQEKTSKDGRRNECKLCRNSYLQEKRRHPDGKFAKVTYIINKRHRNQGRLRNQDIVNLIKLKGCQICGYNKSLKALHFHHINSDKEYTVSYLIAQGASFDTLMLEINKCKLLCANCHSEVHEGIIKL